MKTLIDFLPETFEKVKKQLEKDQSRWGDTWKQRSRFGQEDRIFARYMDYYDQYRNAGVPIPWEKVIGEAHIALVREKLTDEVS